MENSCIEFSSLHLSWTPVQKSNTVYLSHFPTYLLVLMSLCGGSGGEFPPPHTYGSRVPGQT